MSYVIKTNDGESLELSQEDPDRIKQLASRLELTAVTLADGTIRYLNKYAINEIKIVSRQSQSVDTNKATERQPTGVDREKNRAKIEKMKEEQWYKQS